MLFPDRVVIAYSFSGNVMTWPGTHSRSSSAKATRKAPSAMTIRPTTRRMNHPPRRFRQRPADWPAGPASDRQRTETERGSGQNPDTNIEQVLRADGVANCSGDPGDDRPTIGRAGQQTQVLGVGGQLAPAGQQ